MIHKVLPVILAVSLGTILGYNLLKSNKSVKTTTIKEPSLSTFTEHLAESFVKPATKLEK